MGRSTYRVPRSQSTFPCILLKSLRKSLPPISAYSRVLAGYNALAFHPEITIHGHTVLVAFPNTNTVKALLLDFKAHPLRVDGRGGYEVDSDPAETLTFDPEVESWVVRGARKQIIIRNLPMEDEKLGNAIVGYISNYYQTDLMCPGVWQESLNIDLQLAVVPWFLDSILLSMPLMRILE